MSLLKKNAVYIVGELVEVKDFKNIQFEKDGETKNAVAATVVIKCQIGAKENLIEARSFISELTAKGTVNKNYSVISNIKDMLNKRVVISGATLASDRFWSSNSQQLVNSTKVNFNLIRLARVNEAEDKATFEFGGFVTNPLTEVLDEDGNTRWYEISLAQANYREDNMFVVRFIVDKDNAKAAKVIEDRYESGSTVEISGDCSTVVTQTVVETEVAFGDPVAKTYTHVDKKYIITGGSDIVKGEGEYTEDVIANLIDAYKREGIELQNKASSGGTKTASPSAQKPKKTSLSGLI